MIAWLFAAAVAVTAVQRIMLGIHLLRGVEQPPSQDPSHPQIRTNKEHR